MPRRASLVAVALAAAPIAGGGALVAYAAGGDARPHQAGGTFVFDGRGFGHGVGMSQYGARARALAGAGHEEILAHYYPGTALERIAPRTVRVLLADTAPAATVSSPRPLRAVGRVGAAGRAVPLHAGTVYRVRALPGGRTAVERAGRPVAVFRGAVRLEPVAGLLSWGRTRPEAARRYRGALRIAPRGAGVRVVNIVGIENYLRGVVPREMPPSWGHDAPAAVRAQAVAARSYALATLRRGDDFDMYDDTRSQVYGGVASEDPRTTRAVVQTRGVVATYDGAIATTYFHSTSGGRTEDVTSAWPGSAPQPYLVSVDDAPDAISPVHTWTRRFTAARLGALLQVGGPVASVEVLQRGASPRVLSARVSTVAGRSVTLTGAQIRARLGLMDTWFVVRRT